MRTVVLPLLVSHLMPVGTTQQNATADETATGITPAMLQNMKGTWMVTNIKIDILMTNGTGVPKLVQTGTEIYMTDQSCIKNQINPAYSSGITVGSVIKFEATPAGAFFGINSTVFLDAATTGVAALDKYIYVTLEKIDPKYLYGA